MINKAIPAAETRIATAHQTVAAAKTERDTHPARLPANLIDPDATRARLRTHRRALQMVLRLLAYNAEHWLATALNTYLQDPTSTGPPPATCSTSVAPSPTPPP